MLQVKEKLVLELRQTPNTGEAESVAEGVLKMYHTLFEVIRNNKLIFWKLYLLGYWWLEWGQGSNMGRHRSAQIRVWSS